MGGERAGTYTYDIETPWKADEIPSQWLPILTDVISEAGYSLRTQVPGSATYNRRYSPGLFWVGYILFFPFGLLLLLARPVQPLSATWSSTSGGSSAVRIVSADQRLLPLFDRIDGSRRVR